MGTKRTTFVAMAAWLLAAGCSGSEGTVGAPGEAGADGLSTLVAASPEAAGENCAEGGQRIAFGRDLDADGELDEDEIEGSTYVCNGTSGEDGESGEQGPAGEDGENGQDGATSLIATSEEPPGAFCEFGGLRVDYGVDTSADGVLDPDEITGTDYVCNGSDAPQTLFEISDEPAGENCAAGGQRVDAGRDLNRNSALDEAEIASTSFLCNGVHGDPGADGLNAGVLLTDEPAGVNCQWGGQRMDVGIDQNANGTLDAAEIEDSVYFCDDYQGVTLSTHPGSATVFNSPDHCYYYANNLMSGIWHRESNRIISGHFSSPGYYSHLAETDGYAPLPDNDTGATYNRLVHAPMTDVVVRSVNAQYPAQADSILVGSIDAQGQLGGFEPAVFSDGFSGNCNLFSASPSEFLCFDGTRIRHYETTRGSAELTFVKNVALSSLPGDVCDAHCFGGTFAWDGAYYYFASSGSIHTSRGYLAYDATGVLDSTHTASGNGAINATYFDWSVGRYTTHDGWGNRNGVSNYSWAGGGTGDDSQCYSAPSPYHANTH